jgi:hypothetical protein
MNDELESTCKGRAAAYFKVLSQHFLGENTKILNRSGAKFELGSTQM